MTEETDKPLSLRSFLVLNVIMATGCDFMTAMEAVSSTALANPEWNMDQRETWADWEAIMNRQRGY